MGQHPLVTWLLAGAFNSRPPQPRYTTTWDVHMVLSYLKGQGENKTLSLKDLTLKTVMLLALTRPSRLADLHLLNVDLCQQSPEGVTFSSAGLTKQARPSNPHQEFVFSKFTPDPSICPVVTVNQYMERTEILRHPEGGQRASQLFISWIKPHQPVTLSSIAQWLKTTLERAGIDVSIFKAHSTRGASASSVAAAGITTKEILSAADWSTESVFQKFYYKPVLSDSYSNAVLSGKK